MSDENHLRQRANEGHGATPNIGLTSAEFQILQTAFIEALKSEEVSNYFPGYVANDEQADNITIDGHFNIDLALRRALGAVGIEVST